MLGILRGDRAFREFKAHYLRALNHESASKVRLESSISALALLPKIDSWPRSFVSRRRAEAVLLGVRARQLSIDRQGPPTETIEAVISDLERSIQLLSMDGEDHDWAVNMMNLSIAYADRCIGPPAENLDTAISLAQRAKSCFTRLKESDDIARASANLAGYWRQRKNGDLVDNLNRALNELKEAQSIWTFDKHPIQWARLNASRALLFADSRLDGVRENQKVAMDLYRESLSVLTKEVMPADWSRIHHNFALFWFDRVEGSAKENLEQAVASIEAALSVHRGLLRPDEIASRLLNKSSIYLKRIAGFRPSNLEVAMASAQEALEIFQDSEIEIMIARAKAARAHIALTRHQVGCEIDRSAVVLELKEATDISRRLQDIEGYTVSLHNLGLAYLSDDTENRAEKIERAVRIFSELMELGRGTSAHDHFSAATNLADAYMDRLEGSHADNVNSAISYYESALKYFEEGGFEDRTNTVRINLATAFLEKQTNIEPHDCEHAIALLEKALDSKFVHEDHETLATIALNLGSAYMHRLIGSQTRNTHNAVQLLVEAAKHCGPDTNIKIWAASMTNLVSALLSVSSPIADPQTAKACTEFVLARLPRQRYPQLWLHAQLAHGEALTHLASRDGASTFEEAIQAYQECFKVIDKASSPVDWARTKSSLGKAYANWHAKDPHIDIKLAQEAIEDALSVFSPDLTPIYFFQSKLQLGRLYACQSRWTEADQSFSEAIAVFSDEMSSEADRHVAAYVRRYGGWPLSLIPLAALMVGDVQRALILTEEMRARALRAALAADRLASDENYSTDILSLVRYRYLGEQVLDGKFADKRLDLLKDLEALRRLVAAELNQCGSACERVGPLDIEASLADLREWVFMPMFGDGIARALLLPPGGTIDDVRISDAIQFGFGDLTALLTGGQKNSKRSWLDELRKVQEGNLTEHWLDTVMCVARTLWHAFGSWIDEVLNPSAADRNVRLVIIPQGPLGLLPMSLASPNPHQPPILLDKYEVSYSPSLGVLHQLRARAASSSTQHNLALMLRSDDRDDSRSLKSVALERALASQTFPSDCITCLSGQELTREHALEALKRANHWHFATHGHYAWQDPAKSSLVLTGDERIRLGFLAEVDAIDPPRLVVLSACETGIYDFVYDLDEFVGFPSAFLQIGAAGVIGTLWPVNDAACALVLGRFYQYYIGDGMRPALALKTAQLWLRDATAADLRELMQTLIDDGYLLANEALPLDADLTAFHDDESPFSLPISWGGFVYYGI